MSQLQTYACISCGKILHAENIPHAEKTYNVVLEEGQVEKPNFIHPGMPLKFQSYGNYGSIFDYSGFSIEGYLCDECFLQKAERLYAYPMQETSPCIGDCLITHPSIAGLLTEHPSFVRHYKKYDKFGPIHLQKYANGESWTQGLRSYREIASDQRSEAERVLNDQQGGTVSVPREILSGLLGALMSAEYLIWQKLVESHDLRYQNETMKEHLAGVPQETEISALLHKEAAELSVSELKDLQESARWSIKLERWFSENHLFHEDGTEFDLDAIFLDLEENIKGPF